jgi:hypothetical protein
MMVLLDNTCDHVDGSPVNAASIGITERHPLPDGWGLTAWGRMDREAAIPFTWD